jgi:TonB family protein
MGAGHLFWGEKKQSKDQTDQVERARSTASEFVQKIREIEQEKVELTEKIRAEEWSVVDLTDAIVELQEEEEAARNEFVVVREMPEIPYRPMAMPWTDQADDKRRFRKTVGIALLVLLCLGVVVKLWVFPVEKEPEVVEIPKQLVKLVETQHPKPPPPMEIPPEKEQELAKESGKATNTEKQHARAKAMKSGVLAFKEGFSDLMGDSKSLRLGADASINTKGQLAVGPGVGSRSLVVAQAQAGGSGGINSASISRGAGVGGGRGGNGLGGVAFTRVQSGVADMKGQSDRPLSDGPGPSRTDEEIQIVFDRYKASLYRMYQHELRSDPTLRGKMVLRITIEPNGSVSSCTIQSSDLASATLKNEVVERVKKFNFGAKDGVSRITILYPIDFLPAS